ncbi:hypothetical protein [Lentzea cavernae]|uniref:Tip attachment protein J domain-containing protein n=1 Tax=Lentzea cavernae TaxID=2020703 RepID=A0ABQ3MQD8_9PSEU|nr:hypothetical protein [Lentzea cavernae]GHH57707.1 hypothetical protein GCM10017774_77720 [Lentzea cavernae]
MGLRNDIVTRLFLGTWQDVSSDLSYDAGLNIQRGRRSEDSIAPPQESDFELFNADGRYTERNPLSPWYTHLGHNNPHETSLRLARDTGSTVVSNGWGTTEAHPDGAWATYSWTNSGGANSDYAKTGSALTHTIGTANSGRRSELLAFDQREVDVTYSLTLGFTDVQVGALATDFLFRAQDSSTYYMTRLLINTDETVYLALYDGSGNPIRNLIIVDGITHTAGQALHIRVQADGSTFRCKLWKGADRATSEPYGWDIDITDDTGFNTALLDASGYIAVQSVVGAGNTNVPVTFSYNDIDIRLPLAFDYISEWPQNRDETGEHQTVAVTGAGVRRRLIQEKKTTINAVRTFLRQHNRSTTQGIRHYWPLEDSGGVAAAEPEVGTVPLYLTTGQDTSQSFGKGTLASWLGPACKMFGLDSLDTLDKLSLPGFVAADGWMVDHVRKGAWSSDYALRVRYGNNDITVTFEHAIDEIDVNDPSGSTIVTYVPPFDGGLHHIRLTAQQVGGNITWVVYVDGTGVLSNTYAGTLTRLREVSIDDLAAHTNDFSVGHVCVYDAAFSDSFGNNAWDAVFGFAGETALNRMERVCGDYDVQLAWIGDQDATATMGPQQIAPLMSVLEDCEKADDGLLYEQRSAASLVYRSLNSMLGRDSRCTISMSAKEISPPWQPTRDDRLVVNKVVAKRDDGGEYTYELTSGRMSTAAPEDGGVGSYEKKVELNVDLDSALSDQASWRVARGTVDEYRYPSVVVDLHRTEIWQDNPELYRRLIELDVGDQITLEGMDTSFVFGPTPQLVIGYTRVLDQFRHTLTIVFAPAAPFRSGVLDDDEAWLDAETTVLNADMATASDTTFKVRSSSETWTTSVGSGVPILVGGEEMLATAIGSSNPTFVSVGTATHGDNASVTPGTPASSQVGDVMLILAAIRNPSGTANPNPPAGYEIVQDGANVRLFGKEVASNGEAPPQITFTGGAAGDTTSAQACVLRGVSLTAYDTEFQINSSAQNIACTPPLTPYAAKTLVVQWGWKQDDWTSVATLTGMTEIGEPSSTTGNDQGVVWDYQVCDGLTTGPTGSSFTVTGGASAVSRAGAVAFHATQAFTVTRATNGCAGLVHAAGTPVNVARPLIVGLS